MTPIAINMPTAFKKCIIALTGDFDKPYEKVKKWIELQGGQCSLKIGPNVTHLVCSEDHYKKGVSMGEFTFGTFIRACSINAQN